MPEFRRASQEKINVFPVEGEYWFKHYVEDDLFAEIGTYYREYDYRFEVPAGRFERVRTLLEEHGYAPVVIEDPTPFAVLKRKYTDHPKLLFRGAVYQRDLGSFNCFVMKDRDSVERAVEAGATRLAETDHSL